MSQLESLKKKAIQCHKNKQYQEAIKYYQEIIKVDSKDITTYHNFGNLLKKLNLNKEALQVYSMGLKQNSKDFNLHNNVGMVFENLGNNDKAITAYKNAVRINPKFAKAVNNIGVVLYKQKKYEQSAKIFQIALDVDPQYIEVYSNMGAAFNKAKNYDESIKSLETAIAKMPKNSGAYTNLGNVYNKLHEYKKATKLHEKAIELEPNGYNAYSNVGTSYKNLGLTTKAINSYKKAIEIKPDFENAHFDLATIYLSEGNFKNGWREYEWRFKKDEMSGHILNNKDIFSRPMFKGNEDVKDKTILLHCEQGFGDSIQLIRFLPQFKEKFACKIAVKCRDELQELFKNIKEIDVLTNRSESIPEFDYHLSIMSMPYILGISSPKELITKTPYITMPNENRFEIKKEKDKINIGICWSASVTSESYEERVLKLESFLPLINNDKINVYSLQLGPDKEKIKELGIENKIIDLTDKLTDFSKTASLIQNLDLVVSSDTSIVHLCGALDIPTWVLVPKIPDWRWQIKGEKSVWYKSVKIFRQKQNRNWQGVFQSLFAKMNKEYKLKLKI
jgi:tetratricopeptide (TPR) repeat protein